MFVILYHSFGSAPSRQLVSALGQDPLVEEADAEHLGLSIKVTSSPFLLFGGSSSVRVAPTVLYKDSKDTVHNLEFPYNWEAVKLWIDQIERSL